VQEGLVPGRRPAETAARHRGADDCHRRSRQRRRDVDAAARRCRWCGFGVLLVVGMGVGFLCALTAERPA
jgi:hypothetical protein